MKHLSIAVIGIAVLSLTGCQTPMGNGALIGGGSGALLGGLIGQDARSAGIGAVVGALGGAAAGKLISQHDDTLASNDQRGLAYGRRVEANVTQSPYGEHRLVDTTGLAHGAVVFDPETHRKFIKP